MLYESDGTRRKEAVKSLGRIATVEVLPYLSQALQDPNGEVREEAIKALDGNN